MFPLIMIYDESKISLVRTSFFYSALAILEPQIYVVVEQFGAEIISYSGRLVTKIQKNYPTGKNPSIYLKTSSFLKVNSMIHFRAIVLLYFFVSLLYLFFSFLQDVNLERQKVHNPSNSIFHLFPTDKEKRKKRDPRILLASFGMYYIKFSCREIVNVCYLNTQF